MKEILDEGELDGGDGGLEASGPGAHRRPRRRVAVALAVVGGLVVTTGLVGWTNGWLGLGGTAEASDTADLDPPAATAEVTRQTLTQTREITGTLGHGDAYPLITAGPGIITGIADQGTELARGLELYRLNERPVTAMYGPIPMYRSLQQGATGVDVEQLETNLAELGYEGFTVDDTFTDATARAVRQWQADLGIAETGVVEQSDVVFVPDGGRVDTIHTGVGGVVAQGSAVLDITGLDHVVSLEVEVADRDLLAVDTAVALRLPGGEEAAGVVTAANVVAADSDPNSVGGAGGAADTITKVEVQLEEPVDESLLGSPVDVVIDIEQREDVLAVPVNALLALAGGGHGLEVVAGDGTASLVPVESGLFAQGLVEIEGNGIVEGTVVGVAGR